MHNAHTAMDIRRMMLTANLIMHSDIIKVRSLLTGDIVLIVKDFLQLSDERRKCVTEATAALVADYEGNAIGCDVRA